MTGRLFVMAIAAGVLTHPGGARADGTCISLLVVDATPAHIETTGWLGAGVASTGGDRRFVASLGFESTVAIGRFGADTRYGGPFELRGFPWVAAHAAPSGSDTSDGPTFDAEAGVGVLLTQVAHAQWGTYWLRAGLGARDLGGAAARFASLTLLGGTLYAPARRHERGACDPVEPPHWHGLFETVRFYATARRALDDSGASSAGGAGEIQWLFGIELTPAVFLPPYSWRRLAGMQR